jgi:hypothetical protein
LKLHIDKKMRGEKKKKNSLVDFVISHSLVQKIISLLSRRRKRCFSRKRNIWLFSRLRFGALIALELSGKEEGRLLPAICASPYSFSGSVND